MCDVQRGLCVKLDTGGDFQLLTLTDLRSYCTYSVMLCLIRRACVCACVCGGGASVQDWRGCMHVCIPMNPIWCSNRAATIVILECIALQS
jgi:hypothetical protein